MIYIWYDIDSYIDNESFVSGSEDSNTIDLDLLIGFNLPDEKYTRIPEIKKSRNLLEIIKLEHFYKKYYN